MEFFGGTSSQVAETHVSEVVSLDRKCLGAGY
jgi:hypothetical protein